MIEKFPGILGYNGVIAIHADWANYPRGMGWESALKTMGNFPSGTEFYEIDDIDRCKLFITTDPSKVKDPYDYRNFHIAVWHEDLLELQKNNLIEGILPQTEFDFELERFEKLKNDLKAKEDVDGNLIVYYKDKGNIRTSIYKRPQSDEDEYEDFNNKTCASVNRAIKITEKGLRELNGLAHFVVLSNEINELTEQLIKIQRYDTAIREAAVFLEFNIKQFHNVSLIGHKLIEFHIKSIVKQNNDFYSPIIKGYRGELRTVFSFIRNEFAHNLIVLSKEQCILILARIDETYREFIEVKNAYYNQNGS